MNWYGVVAANGSHDIFLEYAEQFCLHGLGNIANLMAFLKSVEAVYRRLDGKVIEPKESDLSGRGHVLLKTRNGPLDVLAVIEGGRSYDDLLGHTVEIHFRGHILRVLDLKSIIEFKKSSADPIDKQRLPVLRETLRQLEENYDRREGKEE